MWRAWWAIVERELKWTFRQRGRLVSAMVRPLLWLVTVGAGFEAMLEQTGEHGYRAFLVPGLVAMVLLFGAMLGSLSLAYDRESGVMRMLIVAPFPHYWIILARTFSAALSAIVQAFLLLLILAPLGYLSAGLAWGALGLGLVATALACAAGGMLLAVSTRSLENFAVVMNFVIFPVFFLSGALYPVHHLPAVLRLAAALNPFSYGVDLLKHAAIFRLQPPFGYDFSIARDLSVLATFIVAATTLACLRFSRESVVEPFVGLLSGNRER